MPYLVLDSGSGEKVQYRISEAGLKLGRDPDCDLVLPSDAASRHHATVFLKAGKAHFRDEKSHNGSLVNGRKVEEKQLADGDRLVVGGFTLIYMERDPYGEDSVQMSVRAAAEMVSDEPEPWNAPSSTASAKAAPAPAPAVAAAPPAASRTRVPVALLVFVFGFTILLLTLFAWVAWQALPDSVKRPPGSTAAPEEGSGAALPLTPLAEAPPPWRDEAGIVEVPQPQEFTRGEVGGRSIQFVGPGGAKYASSITVEVTPASAGATTSSEHALVERSLAAELGARFQRLSAGPLTVGGEPMMFLIYQRSTAEGVVIQNWVVLGIREGHRVAFRLTAEMAQWDRLRGLFGSFLGQVRFPPPVPPAAATDATPEPGATPAATSAAPASPPTP